MAILAERPLCMEFISYIFWKKLAHTTWQMIWYFFEGQKPCLYSLNAEILALMAFTQKFIYVAHKPPLPLSSSSQAVPVESYSFLLSPDAVSGSNPAHSEILPVHAHWQASRNQVLSLGTAGQPQGKAQKPGRKVSIHVIPQQPHLHLGTSLYHQLLTAPASSPTTAWLPSSQLLKQPILWKCHPSPTCHPQIKLPRALLRKR